MSENIEKRLRELLDKSGVDYEIHNGSLKDAPDILQKVLQKHIKQSEMPDSLKEVFHESISEVFKEGDTLCQCPACQEKKQKEKKAPILLTPEQAKKEADQLNEIFDNLNPHSQGFKVGDIVIQKKGLPREYRRPVPGQPAVVLATAGDELSVGVILDNELVSDFRVNASRFEIYNV